MMKNLTISLAPDEWDSLQRLADELATTPTDALTQLAAHGRQGWPWLLGIDVRHQLRTLLMQRLRPRQNRIAFRLPRHTDPIPGAHS